MVARSMGLVLTEASSRDRGRKLETMTKTWLVRAVFGALLLVTAPGCSDEETSGSVKELPAGRYAVATRVADSESNETTYIAVVDDLMEGDRVDLSGALELGADTGHSRGVLYPGHRPGTFFVYTAPLMTRFEATAEGNFRETGRLSFQSVGLTADDSGFVQIFSEQKGYHFSGETFEVVVWNPTTMKVERSFPMPVEQEAEQYSPVLTFGVGERRGNEVIFGIWYSDFELEIVPDLNYILVIDGDTDEFVGVTREERCGGIINTMTGADGTVYLTPDVWTAAIYRLDEARAPEPCLLRIKPGEYEPDPSYQVDLADLTGTPYTSGLMAAGGDAAYFHTIDEATAGIDEEMTAAVLHGGPWWNWVRVDLATQEHDEPLDGLLGGTHYYWPVGDDFMTYTSEADFSEATLLRTNVPGAPERGRLVPGTPTKIIALR
jgi:hypothetical protein